MAAADHANAGWRAYDTGYIHHLRQQGDSVLACADRATAHWDESKAGARERAVAIRLRGIGYLAKSSYVAAIAAYREALDLDRGLATESVDAANGLNALAEAERHSGDLTAAEGHYHDALRVARVVGYAEGVAYISGNLTELALDREEWSAAESLAREALPLAAAVHRQELIGSNNNLIAIALIRQGKKSEALSFAERAVEIYQKLGSPHLSIARRTLDECSS